MAVAVVAVVVVTPEVVVAVTVDLRIGLQLLLERGICTTVFETM